MPDQLPLFDGFAFSRARRSSPFAPPDLGDLDLDRAGRQVAAELAAQTADAAASNRCPGHGREPQIVTDEHGEVSCLKCGRPLPGKYDGGES